MMPRGRTLKYPGHNAIDVQESANWHIIPSTEEEREEIRKTQRTKLSIEKKCWFCGQKFDYGYSSLHVCGACKIIVPCSICGKEFELNLNNFSGSDTAKINNALFSGNNIVVQCSKSCKAKASAQGNIQYNIENPDAALLRVRRSIANKFCEKCNAKTKHRGNYCMACHGKNAVRQMIQYGKEHPEKEAEHRRNCAKSLNNYWDKHPVERAQNAIKNLGSFAQSSFVNTGDQIFYYVRYLDKLVEINELIQSLDMPSNDPRYIDHKMCSGINKRLGVWCKGTTPLIGGDPIKLGANFLCRNQLYYKDASTGEYVPWLDYVNKFKVQNLSIEGLKGWKTIQTFRSNDSESWKGAKQTFEQYLIDLGITWFAYIKFYIDANGELKPLVVGKTGSLLVNKHGSDISFSTNVEHGPARRFLHDTKLLWCKTEIMVYPCSTELEAYNVEKDVAKAYNLFQS